ncbi:MAG: translation elongation factor Ts [Phycisphaerae bacterium]|nr:translation elongation factor Ts [Phycisphaerae bacterium]
MAEITAAQVRALRDKTGLPMMECKAALTESGGDEEAAIDLLQKKNKGKLEAKAHRETAEGRIGIYVSQDRASSAMIEIRCETPPVAKNEMFAELSNKIAQQVAAGSEETPSPESILAADSVAEPGKTVAELMEATYARIKENMKLTRCRKMTGQNIASYIHFDGSLGVLVSMDSAPSDPQVAKDLCMHIAFAKPLGISRDEVPAEEVEKVRKLAADVARAEGKPDKIIDKIVEGKVAAFHKEKVLMEQEHVKEAKTSVEKVLKAAGVSKVTGMLLMSVGGL